MKPETKAFLHSVSVIALGIVVGLSLQHFVVMPLFNKAATMLPSSTTAVTPAPVTTATAPATTA